MVNKQYNVQSLSKKELNNQSTAVVAVTASTSLLKPNFTVISSVPNNNNKHNHFISSHVIDSSETALAPTKQSAFERNITQHYRNHSESADYFDFVDGNFEFSNNSLSLSATSAITSAINDNENCDNDDSRSKTGADRLGANESPNKPLSINDIGRFQYILQMDREMGLTPQNESVFRLPPLLPTTSSPSSNSNSLTSGYWKASSQSPITSQTSPLPSVHTRRERFIDCMGYVWKYAMWPIALIIVCFMVAAVVYFLLTHTDIIEHPSSSPAFGGGVFKANRNGDSERNAINFLNNYNSINRSRFSGVQQSSKRPNKTVLANNTVPILSTASSGDSQATLIPKLTTSWPSNIKVSTTTARTISAKSIPNKILSTASSTTTTFAPTSVVYASGKPSVSSTSTTRPPSPAPKNVKVYTNSGDRRKLPQPAPKHTTLLLPHEDDLEENVVERSKLLFPSKETLENFGFTSGHQNNFGVPIEEDERVLRMLNEQMISNQRKLNQSDEFWLSSITTDSNVYQTKVSPTLPNIKKNYATTERVRSAQNNTDDGVCQSTAIPLCRGILPYDLTNVKMAKPLTPQDLEHFQYLIESKCSHRTHEFVCSILEPECRPERMGPLLPCKRICKSIQEACADVVASSEMLTATFDCDIYPNSNDENECKDITRGTKCFKNEFQCRDKTCIPSQWRCDNIRDCADAEDEQNCSICEDGEFKCANSDKCIPEKWHCDQYEDCPDASDERDCEVADESRTATPTFSNARTFPFVQEIGPTSPTSRPYSTASPRNTIKTKLLPISFNDPIDILDKAKRNRVKNVTRDDYEIADDDGDEIQGDASGITVPISKSLANFRDSKEIMMTSDSEAEYKYSSSNYVPVQTSAYISQCPKGELRCINGHCITISQLCDKITDCPDGADEQLCTY